MDGASGDLLSDLLCLHFWLALIFGKFHRCFLHVTGFSLVGPKTKTQTQRYCGTWLWSQNLPFLRVFIILAKARCWSIKTRGKHHVAAILVVAQYVDVRLRFKVISCNFVDKINIWQSSWIWKIITNMKNNCDCWLWAVFLINVENITPGLCKIWKGCRVSWHFCELGLQKHSKKRKKKKKKINRGKVTTAQPRGRSWVCYCNYYHWQLINNWKYIKKALGFDKWLIAYHCRTLKIEKRQQKSCQKARACLQIWRFN